MVHPEERVIESDNTNQIKFNIRYLEGDSMICCVLSGLLRRRIIVITLFMLQTVPPVLLQVEMYQIGSLISC